VLFGRDADVKSTKVRDDRDRDLLLALVVQGARQMMMVDHIEAVLRALNGKPREYLLLDGVISFWFQRGPFLARRRELRLQAGRRWGKAVHTSPWAAGEVP
jgi:hypothetical protein